MSVLPSSAKKKKHTASEFPVASLNQSNDLGHQLQKYLNLEIVCSHGGY